MWEGEEMRKKDPPLVWVALANRMELMDLISGLLENNSLYKCTSV